MWLGLFYLFPYNDTILQFYSNPVSLLDAQEGILHKLCFLSIPVVCIKEEPKDAASLVKIEPDMKPLIVTKNGFDGTNYSMEVIDTKEEPLQDDFVSELLNKKKCISFLIDKTFF